MTANKNNDNNTDWYSKQSFSKKVLVILLFSLWLTCTNVFMEVWRAPNFELGASLQVLLYRWIIFFIPMTCLWMQCAALGYKNYEHRERLPWWKRQRWFWRIFDVLIGSVIVTSMYPWEESGLISQWLGLPFFIKLFSFSIPLMLVLRLSFAWRVRKSKSLSDFFGLTWKRYAFLMMCLILWVGIAATIGVFLQN